MSADWKEITLGEICAQQNGSIQTGPFGSQLHTSDYKEFGTPVVMPTNIADGVINETGIARIGSEDVMRLSQHILLKGDIVFSRRGDVTKNALIRERESGWFCGTGCLKVRVGNESIALAEFISQYLRLPTIKEWLIRHAVGATMPNLNTGILSEVPVFLPPLNEQRKIANILNNFDNKIHLNTQTNQTLESIAQAIFKSWFVDFEPVKAKMAVLAEDGTRKQAELAAMGAISGKSEAELVQLQQQNPEQYQQLAETAALFPSAMLDSELGEIPEGWEVKALDEVAHYQNGLALQNFRPDSDDYLPVLKIAQLKKGYADGEEKASPSIKPECIVDNSDVVFSWSGSLMVDVWCGGKVALNQHLFKVTSKTHPKWAYYYFTKHHLADFQRIASDKAVTMGHIKREHLSEAKCALPKSDNISSFTKYIEPLIEKQISLRLETFKLAEIRDSLLPKLLSGEIDLSDIQSEVA